MLKNSDTKIAYWCVVSGSEIWTINGELPLGSAGEYSLPLEKAVVVDSCDGYPVMWLNDAAKASEK